MTKPRKLEISYTEGENEVQIWTNIAHFDWILRNSDSAKRIIDNGNDVGGFYSFPYDDFRLIQALNIIERKVEA